VLEILFALLALIPILILGLFWLFVEYLDWHGRMEIVEKKHPKIWRLMNDRPFRLVMLFMVFALLATDVKQNAKQLETEPPIYRFQMPSAPTIETVRPAPPESPNSLRRRTMRLADDLSKFWADHPSPTYYPSQGQNPASAEERMHKAAWDKYWREVTALYDGRYRNRVIGIIQEYKGKGVDTDGMEQGAEQPSRLWGSAPFSTSGMNPPNCFQDEICQLRELAYHVDAQDQRIDVSF